VKYKIVIICFIVACVSGAVVAQVPMIQTSAAVSSGIQSPICENIPTSSPASCGASWDLLASGIDAGGSGSAFGSATFGSLHAIVKTTSYVHQKFEGDAETMADGGANVYDYLRFPGLTSGAVLRATIVVSGKFSGDLNWVDDPVRTTLSLSSMTNENNFNSCELQSLQGICTASLSVSPGDTVQLLTGFGLRALSICPAVGTDSMSLDYSKPYGAYVYVDLVDANGNTIRGPQGKIKAASGKNYATNKRPVDARRK
jgi:hypothetical protein